MGRRGRSCDLRALGVGGDAVLLGGLRGCLVAIIHTHTRAHAHARTRRCAEV